jgi:catechol 2,3-dioxygenase-like lactoylglutathione lyase family enzyme
MKSIAQQRYVVSLLIMAGEFLATMCVGADTQLLGTGHGIDHVTIEVNNLDETAKTFRDVFGFTLGPRHTPGQDGTLDLPILFNNWTYLELETVWDRQKAAVKSPNELRFLDQHEGAFAFCLETSSDDTTAAWLRGRGHDVDGPSGGTWRPEGIAKVFPEAMKYLDFKQRPVPGAPLWFTEYDDAVRQQIFDAIKRDPVHEIHANGALRLHAVWIAVTNLQSSIKAYKQLGLRPGRELNVPLLGAKAREIPAGTGTILLITPQGRHSRTTNFLNDRGEGIMCVSVEVSDLLRTQSILCQQTKREFPVYSGPYGRSVAIPPELSSGVRIEFFQSPSIKQTARPN